MLDSERHLENSRMFTTHNLTIRSNNENDYNEQDSTSDEIQVEMTMSKPNRNLHFLADSIFLPFRRFAR